MNPKTSTLCAVIATLAGAACAMYVFAEPSLSPPAGAIVESGRFGLGTALSSTNTPGDADSHFKITQSGSYYLTGNLVTSATGSAIEIAADNVVIDLNGFTISSTSGFDGLPVTTQGIFADTANLMIRNGTVRYFRLSGVNASGASAVRAENIHATQVGSMSGMFTLGTGLSLGSGASAVHCTAYNNLNIGFRVEAGSSVIECVAYGNGNVGIQAIDSLVAHCASHGHPTANIDIGITSSTLVGNHAP